MKILLRTALSRYSGYGNDGIGLAQALIRRGHDVYLQTTGVDAPLPDDVAQLFTKELRAPFDLYLNHADPMALKLEDESRGLADVNVGWTMWEYTSFDNMAYTPRRSLRKRLKNFDLMVGYSDVDPGCLRPYFKGPVAIRQGGFVPQDWPEIERDWDSEDFYFCMIGVLSSRKAPFAAIEAFSQLQREHEDFLQHARLSLKTNAPGLHSGIEQAFPGIRIYYDTWPVETVRHFYAEHHVLLAPSRGEGKNMPALEFQSTGGVVIATNFAGHKQWLHPAYNYAVDYTLEPQDIYKPGAKNATVDVQDLKEKMLHVFRNRAEARTKGHIAADTIPKIASWDRAVEDLFLRIKENVPEKGERIWMLDQIARPQEDRIVHNR